jgi:high-affinity iron transporter
MNIAGFIIGFREGLESFMLLALGLKYLKSLNAFHLRKQIFRGAGFGIFVSIAAGFLLDLLSSKFASVSKLWESVFSFLAVLLISTLIFWMIRHGKNMRSYVKNKLDNSLTHLGVFLFASVIVMREGAELVLFSVAGDYDVSSMALGVLLALGLSLLVAHSLVKIKLSLLFKITLIYLILQAAYLLGYSVHEALSAMKGSPLTEDHFLYIKAFDFSSGILNHKDGWIGLPLHIIFGWYSKPEWLAFILHYGFASSVFTYWHLFNKKQ